MSNVDFSSFEDIKKDFTFIYNDTFGESTDLSNMKEYRPNLEPNLVRYFFKNILGYNIEIAPFEKVYFSFVFTYKQHKCYITARKLSYRLYCNEEIKEDLFAKFNAIKDLIEEAFINYSTIQIKNNEYSLPNELKNFNENISFLEKKIIKYNKKIIKMGELRYVQKVKSIKWGTRYYYIDKLKFESKDLSLSIINYIDFQFSKIEHLFSLLYPLIYDVNNDSKPFSEYLESDYRRKIEKCCPNIDVSILNNLSLIKEIHRNRFAHGLFSREKELEIKIPNFGSYFMSVGRKVKGFKYYNDSYDYSDYENFKTTFQSLFDYLKQNYPLQLKVINEGLPIQLDYNVYKDVFKKRKNTNRFIGEYYYYLDRATNMEW